MDFQEIKIYCPAHFNDILVAEFSMLGFDSFVEHEDGFCAYLESEVVDEAAINAIAAKYKPDFALRYEITPIAKKNWNQQWEDNYEPIYIDQQCVVRASFHQLSKSYPYEIIVNPKMSFGTGHHETTFLMLKNQLEINHQGKEVLDVGCGTGVLAIMAKLRGAREVTACDIDGWSIENSRENFRINDCEEIKIQHGDVTAISGQFDIIVANINRNVLMHDLPHYAQRMRSQGGKLLLSGFYREDENSLIEQAQSLGFIISKTTHRNSWSCLLFEK
ncbi:50S ribosomal protein L11 methyltransferase [Fulvivirgaceae bacterium BMA12]|uniref:Ribosomal protein L11 methyltransferase n=1 Tax=Agaribacillus aureus TaxID=3051825 RepID=A0ABT8LJ09_9BACT|nr:50S ribosomal protein L11 methyltransferase [Fulvivirgaceae bacterium BMA12]